MSRRFLIFVVLAVLALASVGAAYSAASFTTASSATLQASTAQVSSDSLSVKAGNGQSAVAASAVAAAPSVLVTDAGGNPVSGVVVTFAVASGGGSATGLTPTTDAFGVATVGSWTLGTIAGANTLTATAAGISGSVTVTATGTPGGASAARSTLTPSSASVTANGTSTQVLTVQAKDANGNDLSSGGATVTITKSSGSGSLGAVTDNHNGTYAATATAPAVVGSGVFVATIGGGAVMSGTTGQTQATVTYMAGPLAKFAVAVAGPQTNGVAFAGTCTVTAQDANGNAITGFNAYTGNVTISAGPNDGTISGLGSLSGAVLNQVGDFTNGVASLGGRIVFKGKAGLHTFTATSGSCGGTSGSVSIIAGAATKVQVETAADGSGTVVGAQSLASGSTITAYAISRDASDNFVANVSASWSLAGVSGGVVSGDLVGSSTATTGTNAVLTGRVIGGATLHAVSGILTTTDSGVITVIAGAATRLNVSIPATTTAGTPFSVTVTAQDANGNTATGYRGTVIV